VLRHNYLNAWRRLLLTKRGTQTFAAATILQMTGVKDGTIKYYITIISIIIDIINNNISSSSISIIISYYYMAVSHKDWELPNSRI